MNEETESFTEEELEKMYNPETASEWIEWVDSIDESKFQDKADVANTGSFVKMLKTEHELSSKEVGMVLCRFANRYEELGLVPPRKRQGDYVGYLETMRMYDMFNLEQFPP